jgi:hypothetical protein
MHASDWAAIGTAVTSLIAIVLSYLSYRRGQDIRRDVLQDRRTSQARLITAWWTRVDQSNEDLIVIDATTAVWPEEAGYRI